MTRRTRVPPTTLCRRLDINPQNYFNWASAGLLRKAGTEGCGQRDAVELAVLAALNSALGLRRVRPSWQGLRQELRQRVAAGDVIVVYRETDDLLQLALSKEEAGRLVVDAGPVREISVAQVLVAVRTAYVHPQAWLPRRRTRNRVATAESTPN